MISIVVLILWMVIWFRNIFCIYVIRYTLLVMSASYAFLYRKRKDRCEFLFRFEWWIVVIWTVLVSCDIPISHFILLEVRCFDLTYFCDKDDVNYIYIMWYYLRSVQYPFLGYFQFRIMIFSYITRYLILECLWSFHYSLFRDFIIIILYICDVLYLGSCILL